MAESDQTPSDARDAGQDSADTASFQQFVDERDTGTANDGRTFRLLSLVIGAIVLLVGIYLLLQ